MVALGLVTTDHLEGKLTAHKALVSQTNQVILVQFCSSILLCAEIQLKRQERKRRTTANPAYSGLFEPEVRKPFPHHTLVRS